MKATLRWTARPWRVVWLLAGATLVAGMLAAPAWAVETRGGDRIEVGPGEVVNDDLYAFGDTVMVEGTVEGDLVAFGTRVVVDGTVEGDLISAAQAVEVNGTVEDDARIAGQALVLGEDARVEDDLFAGGYSLENRAGSAVGGSLFYGGYQALLAGTVEEDLKTGLTALELRGEIGGDVDAAVGDQDDGAPSPQFVPASPVSIPAVEPGLTLTDSASVGGDLAYTSSEEGGIADGAQVAGDVSRDDVPAAAQQEQSPNPVAAAVFDHLRRLITLLLVGALALWILPGWTRSMADRVRERPLQSLGWGALGSAAVVAAVFVGLLVAVLLAVVFGLLTLGGVAFWTVVLWALGIAALVAAYLISAVYLAPVVVALAGGRLLLRPGQADQRTWTMLALAAGLVVYVVLRSIPIVDTLTGLIVLLLGVGAISGWLWRALRPTKPVADEPSANGAAADKPVVDKPEIKG
jgi:hypothetical protein